MPQLARTIDEILARVASREALYNPRMRGMWAVLVGGAFSLILLLLAYFFGVTPPISLDFLASAGPPYLVLLVAALAIEGLLVTDRLQRHEEPPYPLLTQAAATTVGAVGVVLIGLGGVLLLAWTSVLSTYEPGLTFFPSTYYAVLLSGSAVLLAALPPLGASLIRPFVVAPA